MANEYVNELEINGQKRLDLTQDTATPETVLEGETFHLRSGAPAEGTYRPSDEIEARLEATVGHSSKNLLPITLESDTYTTGGAKLDYTVDKAAGTVTLDGTTNPDGAGYITLGATNKYVGNYYVSGGYSEDCYVRAYDNTARAYCRSWNGSATSGSRGERDDDETSIPAGHTVSLRVFFTAGQTFNNVVLRPMLRSGSISDNTFEPYQIPTDERIASLEAQIAALEAIINNS